MLDELNSAAGDYTVKLLEQANRITIIPKDTRLVLRIREKSRSVVYFFNQGHLSHSDCRWYNKTA